MTSTMTETPNTPAIQTEIHIQSPRKKKSRHSDWNQLCTGDIVTCSVTKADHYQPAGLSVEQQGKKIVVSKVKGLCENIPLQVGDQLLKLNGRDLRGVSVSEVKHVIKSELKIDMIVRRCGPDGELEESDDDSDDEQELLEYDHNGRLVLQNDPHEDNRSEGEDYFPTGYHIDNSLFQPGSAARLDNIDSKPSLNGQTVSVKHESAKDKGTFECELQDGSRVSLSQRYMTPISEQEQQDFQPFVPGSARSLAVCNLIEAGDVMKIRGLKKQAKMNGTMVEILRPSESQPGRWECFICDDKDRVIAVMSENLRHIM